MIVGCYFSYSLLGIRELPEETKSYVESEEFQKEFIQKAGYLRDWIVRYDEQTIFTHITDEEIERYIRNDGTGISKETALKGIINDRNQYYNRIQDELNFNNKNIDYIAVDTEKNRYITNMNKDKSPQSIINELCNRKTYLIGNGYYILQAHYSDKEYGGDRNGHYFKDENYYTGNSFIGQDNYRIYIALKEPLIPGDHFYKGYQDFERQQKQSQRLFRDLFLSLGTGIVLLMIWVVLVGRSWKSYQIEMRGFDLIPFEIQLLLLVILTGVFLIVLKIFNSLFGIRSFYISPQFFDESLLHVLLFSTIIISYLLMVLGIASSSIRHFKNRSMLQHIWFIKTGSSIYRHVLGEWHLLFIVSMFILINILVNSLGVNIVTKYPKWIVASYIISIGWNILCGIAVLKFILEYQTILKGAKAICKGQLDVKVELSKTVPMLTEMAQSINSIGSGLEKAVDLSIKSERLKTELITNVSHDLKTPLTSIISYIDLLKLEPIQNDNVKEYINILDERSHRLKQLIEDLVEASKVMTGNVKAQLEPIRLDQLVGQALGEYADRLEQTDLEIVMEKVEEVCIIADGRHMWRVLENFLSNICKYAMPHTRIYVQVQKRNEEAYLVIKNVSKDPLNCYGQELMERFVRGDSARTTEGTGLGLAIAQSLITLQKGELNVQIDGDLFKIVVKMPLAKNEN